VLTFFSKGLIDLLQIVHDGSASIATRQVQQSPVHIVPIHSLDAYLCSADMKHNKLSGYIHAVAIISSKYRNMRMKCSFA